MNEKDRLGRKLQDKERGDEDRYFAAKDKELLEKIKTREGESGEAQARAAALMRCPRCGAGLAERKLRGVAIEECPECHGMWLDAGELEQLARTEDAGWLARLLFGERER